MLSEIIYSTESYGIFFLQVKKAERGLGTRLLLDCSTMSTLYIIIIMLLPANNYLTVTMYSNVISKLGVAISMSSAILLIIIIKKWLSKFYDSRSHSFSFDNSVGLITHGCLLFQFSFNSDDILEYFQLHNLLN